MKKNVLPFILVGFVAGVIAATLLVGGYYRKNLYTSFSNWAKINVILDEVEKNYVDTIDRKAVTDAALEAALRCLDPHSVYMQPEPLKEADESLAGLEIIADAIRFIFITSHFEDWSSGLLPFLVCTTMGMDKAAIQRHGDIISLQFHVLVLHLTVSIEIGGRR